MNESHKEFFKLCDRVNKINCNLEIKKFEVIGAITSIKSSNIEILKYKINSIKSEIKSIEVHSMNK